MDELELAQRISQREPAALDLLVQKYLPPVYRFLRHLTRHAEDAEDLSQQTLIRAIQNGKRYDGRSELKTWLYAIAFHEFTRWRRRRLWLPLTVDRPSPTDDYRKIIEAESLLDALGRLPTSLRATFLLHYVEGLSIAEIAAALQLPEGTVKRRLHDARQRLGHLLEQEVTYATNPCQP